MAAFRKKILILSSGKQLKLSGTSIAIGKSLEIGEGYAPTIFASAADGVSNPYQLSAEEIMEIRLWHAAVDGTQNECPQVWNGEWKIT